MEMYKFLACAFQRPNDTNYFLLKIKIHGVMPSSDLKSKQLTTLPEFTHFLSPDGAANMTHYKML